MKDSPKSETMTLRWKLSGAIDDVIEPQCPQDLIIDAVLVQLRDHVAALQDELPDSNGDLIAEWINLGFGLAIYRILRDLELE